MLDEIDRQIVNLLLQDGRMTNAALAEAVGLTPTPMLARMRKLEQRGVIRGYTARVDPAAVGRATVAFLHVQMARHENESYQNFLQETARMEEVLEVHHVAGEDDFILKVGVADIAAFERFLLDRLNAIPGIHRTRTTFVLSTPKSP